MVNYIFLDNWALSDFTKEDNQHLLSKFICRNDYKLLFNGLSAVELYNPGWQHTQGDDRTTRVARFLSQHPCAIVRPEKVFKAEIESFPAKIESPPVELDLDDLPPQHRIPALLSILRDDNLLREHGIDIKQWVADYDKVKTSWLIDAEQIIEHACDTGVLARDKNGRFIDLEKSKEKFLVTLDRRHFSLLSSEERHNLGAKVIDLFMGATRTLPAVRFSSLCYWYTYIDTDKAYPMRRKGSDIGDFFQISMIPYCSAFTVDATMYRLVHRVMPEVNHVCRIYDREEFHAALNQEWV
jgi:hypothetical protein